MNAKITLDHLISREELFEIYKTFCKSYNIKTDEKDEKRFLPWNYNALIKDGWLDHRPFMGAKFFGAKHNNDYRFHGYNENLPEQEHRDRKFKEKIEKQFNKSPGEIYT